MRFVSLSCKVLSVTHASPSLLRMKSTLHSKACMAFISCLELTFSVSSGATSPFTNITPCILSWYDPDKLAVS